MAISLRPALRTLLAVGALGLVLAGPGQAQAPDLPQTMPAPEVSPKEPAPEKEPEQQPAPAEDKRQGLPSTPPTPQANPEDIAPAPATDTLPAEPGQSKVPQEAQTLPTIPPAPEERPAESPAPVSAPAAPPLTAEPAAETEPQPAAEATPHKEGPRPQQGPPLPASMVGIMPESERLCRAELTKLGVVFEDQKAESDENGCSMPYPVSVSSFGGGIKVEPPVLDNCAVMQTSAKFLQTAVKEAARKHIGIELTGIANGSGYVCRPRRGTQRLSEHAVGNALDIMSFTFAGGRQVVVEKPTDKSEDDFLAAVRAAACGPYKTVLGPGSDADHANHFHLDLADRPNGGTFCQ